MDPLIWVREYATTRYLLKQTNDALQCRYESLSSNLWSTDSAGNVTPPRNQEQRRAFLRLIVDVLCEQGDRSGNRSISLDEATVRRAASAAYLPPKLTAPFVGSPSGFAKLDRLGRQLSSRVARLALQPNAAIHRLSVRY